MNKSIFDRRVLVAAGLAAGLGLSQTALADTAEDQLEITAGLADALTLSCDTLSFGITRLGELEQRASETTITVPADGGAISVGGDDDEVTAGSVQAGECTISGSNADEDHPVTVTIAGETDGTGSVALVGDASAFSDLDAPEQVSEINPLGVSDFETEPSEVQIGDNGGATFKIGGTLTIPSQVVEDNLGGYRAEVTVEVDDDFGD